MTVVYPLPSLPSHVLCCAVVWCVFVVECQGSIEILDHGDGYATSVPFVVEIQSPAECEGRPGIVQHSTVRCGTISINITIQTWCLVSFEVHGVYNSQAQQSTCLRCGWVPCAVQEDSTGLW